MKRILTIIVFFILTISVVAQMNDEVLIKKNFDSYRTFLNNSNGKEAVRFVDSRSIKYYGDILEYVTNADSLKVESLSLFDKMMVLTVRQIVTKENILKFDGKSLLTYAINNGMIDKSKDAGFTISNITIENHFAKGQIVANGIESSYFVHFYKEDGQWKYDLTSSFYIFTPYLQEMANKLGGENGLIKVMIYLNKGMEQNQNVWNPIN